MLVNDNITKQIANARDGSTPKLNLATKIFYVDSFVVLFSSSFLVCIDLKFDLMFLTQLIWWIRICQIFKKFDQTKMSQILLYALSSLYDSTNLIKLIWLRIFLKTLLVNFFVKTCISVNLFLYSLFFFFLIFSDRSVCVAYLGFYTLLYFEQWVFLVLDNVFPYYNKDTQRNQNRRKTVFCFSHLSVL